jgi:hypothetical protein
VLDLAAAEARVGCEQRAQSDQRPLGGGFRCAVRDDDLDRVGRRKREVAVERGEALLRREPVG